MDGALRVNVTESIKHLEKEEAAAVLAHTTELFDDVEERAAGNVLELEVYEVFDYAAGGLLDTAVSAVPVDGDHVSVAQSLKKQSFLLDLVDELHSEFLVDDFEGDELRRVDDRAAEVDFGSFSLAEQSQKLVLIVENWMVF